VIAMTTQREVAQKYGPALSLARRIVDKQPLPQVGETWKVDADVVEFHLETAVPPSLCEFSFDVVVTPELLADAHRVAGSKQSLDQPAAWLTKVGHYLIDIRPQRPARLETSDIDLVQLVHRLDRMFEKGRQQPSERWVLAYIGLYWFPMIASAESEEFHRGEVHALREALDFFETVFANETGSDYVLLGVVLVGMAGAVAECCLGQRPRFGETEALESSAEIPRKLRRHYPDPLRPDERDIRALAARSDNRRSLQHSRFLQGKDRIAFEKAVSFFIASGESPDFYQGLLYGLCLSRQALLLFQYNVFEQPDSRVQNWEDGLFRMCTFAAKSRQDAVSRQQKTN
jgi:hypothetical protein